MLSDSKQAAVTRRLASRYPLLADGGAALEQFANAQPQREGELLRFLWAFSPMGDLTGYPPEVLADFARHGVFLYDSAPACRALPEERFLHDVVFHRVNNEGLAPCRRLFYDRLAERVAGKSPEEAAMAVNYWCCEEAAYQSSDDRTASALAVFSSARGRCGEESTFTVNALRSVGLPARQVYAPKWAHCDDNHAWVEVFCGDRWRFLGACEPEEALNRGWFVGAASRAMLVHSRYFGDPPADEEALSPLGCAAQLNQLGRYAQTRLLTVQVQDASGAAVPGAAVDFALINYAERVAIETAVTDGHGRACMRTGMGGLCIRARLGDQVAETVATAEETLCRLTLTAQLPQLDVWRDLTLEPPPETAGRETPLTMEQRERGREKLNAANALRKNKIEAFLPEDEVAALCARACDPQGLRTLLQSCRGNLAQLKAFLLDGETARLQREKEALLRALPEKDLADCRADILLDHLRLAAHHAAAFSEEVAGRWLLSPRIGLEPATAWRSALLGLLTKAQREAFRERPEAAWQHVKATVKASPELDYPMAAPPEACLTHGVGSELSRRVLAVAILRTLGVLARLRSLDSLPEYYRAGSFVPVEAEATARLRLEAGGVAWVYRRNWSLARLQGGVYTTLGLEDIPWDGGRLALTLPAGQYRLLTVNRLPAGTVWAREMELILPDGGSKAVVMELRQAAAADMLQRIPLTGIPLPEANSPGPILRIWLRVGAEPTEHILGEMLENLPGYAAVQHRLMLVLERQEDTHNPTLRRVMEALPGVAVRLDLGGAAGEPMARKMYLEPEALPLSLVTDSAGNGVYAACGYNVGAADMLLRVLQLVE